MSIEDVWFSDALWARAARGLLSPLSALFGVGVAARNWRYDTKRVPVISSAVPVISIGNLTVGGTGKTPVAAYFVQLLLARGRHPAIVMRGYGDDEPRVHALLTPGVPVYANPDRVAGIAHAVAQGADVVVLDDAFQHRRAGRDADVVLISADRWRAGEELLPAGSLREPMRALRRATLIVVTHKVASEARVAEVVRAVQQVALNVPVASMHLRLGELVSLQNGLDTSAADHRPLSELAGASVLAIAGVGDPDSFFAQLELLGARVTPHRFPDHHAFTAADVRSLIDAAGGHKYVTSTLKDAVKLAPVWPPKGPALWYVSQAVDVSGGAPFLESMATNVLLRRETFPLNYGH